MADIINITNKLSSRLEGIKYNGDKCSNNCKYLIETLIIDNQGSYIAKSCSKFSDSEYLKQVPSSDLVYRCDECIKNM